MKAIRLFCPCGAVRLFSGRTVDAVIAAIQASGWISRAATPASQRRVRGEADGVCPRCVRSCPESATKVGDSARNISAAAADPRPERPHS
jgi:Fe-S-cluster-containing hydrogenase component 2